MRRLAGMWVGNTKCKAFFWKWLDAFGAKEEVLFLTSTLDEADDAVNAELTYCCKVSKHVLLYRIFSGGLEPWRTAWRRCWDLSAGFATLAAQAAAPMAAAAAAYHEGETVTRSKVGKVILEDIGQTLLQNAISMEDLARFALPLLAAILVLVIQQAALASFLKRFFEEDA